MVSSFTISIGCFANEEARLNDAQPELLLKKNEENNVLGLIKDKVKYGYKLASNKTKYGASLAWNKTKPACKFALNKTKYGVDYALNITKYGASLAWNKTKDFKEITLKAFKGDQKSTLTVLTTLVAAIISCMKICKICKTARVVANAEKVEDNNLEHKEEEQNLEIGPKQHITNNDNSLKLNANAN